MSYKHSNAAREVPGDKFDSSTQRYIFIEVCHLADNQGTLNSSQDELGGLLLLSRPTINKEFQRLIDKGLIERLRGGRYKITLLITRENTAEPLATSSQKVSRDAEDKDPLAGMSELDIWWEGNWMLDENRLEVVPVGMDEVPEFVIEARKEGLLKLRPEKKTYKGLVCLIYERA